MSSLKYGGDLDLIPKRCITIGIKEIFKSKQLKFYLKDNYKTVVLIKTIFEKLSHHFPSTYLKLHKNCSTTISSNVISNLRDN